MIFKGPFDDTCHRQQFSRGEDQTVAKAEEVFFSFFFFCSLDQWQKIPNGGAGGLGGSVSMATSQLGNHYKSKSEGDIKGLNDKDGKGGQGEMGGEDKEERRSLSFNQK